MGFREYYFDPLAFPPSLILALKLQFVNIALYVLAFLALIVFAQVAPTTDPLETMLTIGLTALLSLVFYFFRIHILRKRKPWPRLVFTGIVVLSALRALVVFARQPDALLQAHVIPLAAGCAVFVIIDFVSTYLLFKRDVTDWIQAPPAL